MGQNQPNAQMEYCKETDAIMQRIHIPYDALQCTDVNCKNLNHRDVIYLSFMTILLQQ